MHYVLSASLLLLMLLPPICARADVTLEEVVRTEGAGLMSMANMTIETTTRISGNKARIDTTTQMQSKVVRMFAGGGPTAQIVRLDQDMTYQLDLKKKRYTQQSLAEQRAQMQKAMADAEKAQAQQSQSAAGVDESQCEWSEPKSTVERKGEKAVIAGLDSERVKITASQSCTDRKTGSVCDFALMLDQWLTPDSPALRETQAYHRAYAEKMGLDPSGSADFAKRAAQSFGRYEGIWKEIGAKLKDVQGYPVKSAFALAIGGPKCTSNPEAGETQPQPSASESVGRAVGGALGGALGGMFGRKKAESEETAGATAGAPATPPATTTIGDGLVPLITVSSELRSVRSGSIGSEPFEIPAEFKLQK